MIKQNKRLNALCQLVTERVVADVGSDHGFVPKILLQQKKCDLVYVTDISQKCVQKAKCNLKGYEDFTKFVTCNGIEALFDTSPLPQQILIAGMGGREIIKIIMQDKGKVFNNFILQPQKNTQELRVFLQDNSFDIQKDFILQEGKIFYNIIQATRRESKIPLTLEQIIFGKTNLFSPTKDFDNYLNYKIEKIASILQNTSDNEIKDQLQAYIDCKNKIFNKTNKIIN